MANCAALPSAASAAAAVAASSSIHLPSNRQFSHSKTPHSSSSFTTGNGVALKTRRENQAAAAWVGRRASGPGVQEIATGSRSLTARAVAASEVKTSERVPVFEFDPASFPAVPDTAAPFSIPPEELIERCKGVLASNNGLKNPDLLAEDFKFAAPIIYLGKEEFLKATGSFKIIDGIPDLNPRYHHFRVDPIEPGRVWYTYRTSGTHTGTINFGAPFEATGKKIEGPPEVGSMLFDESGRVKQLTVGYVVDRRIGNTGGLGAIFGIMYALGRGLPFPEAQPLEISWQFKLFSLLGQLRSKFAAKSS